MRNYEYSNGKFIIYDYAKQKPISSFLPGISGKHGIPIWCFYVNRGQGVASFGLDKKNSAILEFSPFNVALERIPFIGFRTFLKLDNQYVEAFKDGQTKMEIAKTYFSIYERNEKFNYEIKVTYSSLPEHSYGALIRKVEFKNLLDKTRNVQFMDGLATIFPYGTSNTQYKRMSNLLKSWMKVEENKDCLLYKLKSTTADDGLNLELDNVVFLKSSSSFSKFRYVYSKDNVFSYDTSLVTPINFILDKLDLDNQLDENDVPCGFTYEEFKLKANEEYHLQTLIGEIKLKDYKKIKVLDERETNKFILRNEEIVSSLVSYMKVKTSNEIFDEYISQCVLDNILRGGHPCYRDNKIQYIYSRKHGDLERDYNDFVTKESYYSFGGGNFRDVLQNRRNDILVSKDAAIENIKYFYSLIQLDGNNPLSVLGERFYIEDKKILDDILNPKLKDLLVNGFNFGDLYNFNLSEKDISFLISNSKKKFIASFTEGYWVDHFIYLVDLLSSFKDIYPEDVAKIYKLELPYYQSNVIVKDKNVCNYLTPNGVRRLSPLEKVSLGYDYIQINDEEYKTSLMSKLVFLIISKLLNLDNKGYGLDMNASRPGWNDALNGLPSLYGSSVTDLIELVRLMEYISSELDSYNDDLVCLDVQKDILKKVCSSLESEKMYEELNELRMSLNERIISNKFKVTKVSVLEAKAVIENALHFIKEKLEEVKALHKGIYPTYVYYDVNEYDIIDTNGDLPKVRINEYSLKKMPFFLEGITKAMYIDKKSALDQYKYVIKSDMYDKELGIFKVSEPLDSCSIEIGRIKTFTKGWLERESCFLHMEYKFLLSLISNGLYDEFFKAIKSALVCNFDVNKYGRSPLENCSFIVPSNHLDKKKIGQGFQPRLSGANAEMISIYKEMFIGKGPFFIKDSKEYFRLTPILSKDMFIDNKVEATLLGMKIIYIGAKDTYKEKCDYLYKLIYEDKVIETKEVNESLCKDIKNHLVKEMQVIL